METKSYKDLIDVEEVDVHLKEAKESLEALETYYKDLKDGKEEVVGVTLEEAIVDLEFEIEEGREELLWLEKVSAMVE